MNFARKAQTNTELERSKRKERQFYPEYDGNRFLCNVHKFLPRYTASDLHSNENLKAMID
jgi:hypothetical protein